MICATQNNIKYIKISFFQTRKNVNKADRQASDEEICNVSIFKLFDAVSTHV